MEYMLGRLELGRLVDDDFSSLLLEAIQHAHPQGAPTAGPVGATSLARRLTYGTASREAGHSGSAGLSVMRRIQRRVRQCCRSGWLTLGADDVLGTGAAYGPELRVGFFLLGTLLTVLLLRLMAWEMISGSGEQTVQTVRSGSHQSSGNNGHSATDGANSTLPMLSGVDGRTFEPI